MTVRRELARDHTAVRAVHAAAFAHPDGDVPPEVVLVDALRADDDVVPALACVCLLGSVRYHAEFDLVS